MHRRLRCTVIRGTRRLLGPRSADGRGDGAFIAEAASSPAAALLTDRFSLNGDMSRTDFIGDHTLRRGGSRPRTRGAGRFSFPCLLGTVRLMLLIPPRRALRTTIENTLGTAYSGTRADG
jgi:hypothetical protein